MKLADIIEGWSTRKMARRPASIREQRVVDVTHKRPLGPRGEFARVVVAASPSSDFSFSSRVEWPRGDNYESAVLDGLLDETFATSLGPLTSGIAFELREIGWHDVDSCAEAFYQAARKAVREVVLGNIVLGGVSA